MLLNFLDDVLLLDFTLESLQSAFQRFTILDDNFSQPIHLLVWGRRILSQPLVKTQNQFVVRHVTDVRQRRTETSALRFYGTCLAFARLRALLRTYYFIPNTYPLSDETSSTGASILT
jgi:hypothetical protein